MPPAGPAVTVVKKPGCQADGGVRQSVQRLRARPHHGGVGAAPRIQGGQLLVRAPFVSREAGRRRVAGLECPGDVGRNRAGHIDVNAEQLRRRLLRHHVRDRPRPSRRPAPRTAGSRGASSARPRHARCGPGPSRSRSACRKTRSPAATESPDGKRPMRSRRVPWDWSSGSMIFSCSMTEPGHPCVTMSGSAFVMLRANVNEMNVEPVDLGDELRQGVQPRLALAPVVICRPVARELLHRRERHALRIIRDRFPLGPPGCVYAPAELGQLRFRNTHMKRVNGLVNARLLCAFGHSSGPPNRPVAPFMRRVELTPRCRTLPRPGSLVLGIVTRVYVFKADRPAAVTCVTYSPDFAQWK